MNRISNFYSIETGRSQSGGEWYIWCRLNLGNKIWYNLAVSKDYPKLLLWLDQMYLPEYVYQDATLQLQSHQYEIMLTQSGRQKSLIRHYIDWCLGLPKGEGIN